MNKKILFFTIIALVSSAFSFKDKLEGKSYRIIINEKKGDVYSEKSFQHIIEFEKGKLYCDAWLYEKFAYKELVYKIIKDTSYIEEDDSVNLVTIYLKGKNDMDEDLKGSITFTNSDCEGAFKIFRKDVLKKVFEFSGSEQATKK
jgi:hypothetical protein